MSIFNFKENKAVLKIQSDLNRVRNDFKVFRFTVQGYIDAMTGEESVSIYGNNSYRDYARAVQAINSKYENAAAWGNGLAANIIDFRAAVTVSSGPQYKPAMNSTIQQKDEDGKSVGNGSNPIANIEDNAQSEMDFCRDFFDVNNINHEAPQELGREAEIEGVCAVELKWDETKKQVIVKHYPWLTYKYIEVRSKENPKEIESIKWEAQTGIEAGEIKGDNLICLRFSGRLSSKYPTTKVMRCLTQIDYIDQAFRDWREINRMYAAPIPIFECDTDEEAENMRDAIKAGLNFKIKKAWAVRGKFRYAGPEMSGIDSLEREIKRQACFVAGTTGYPLQFLLPDMLSNRSTSENIMESALIHTASERAIWTGFYEELIKKAMMIYSTAMSKTPLDPNKIAVSISLMTQEQWQRLTSFWLPAFKDDLVTREAVLPMIPDFNVREELDRRDEADNSRIAQITAELDKVKKESNNPPPTPGQNNNLPAQGQNNNLPAQGQEGKNGIK